MKAGLGGRGRVQEGGPIVRRQPSFRIEGEGEKAEKECHSWAAVRERAWPHKLELKAQERLGGLRTIDSKPVHFLQMPQGYNPVTWDEPYSPAKKKKKSLSEGGRTPEQ